jgi:Fe-S-cluster containining protein
MSEPDPPSTTASISLEVSSRPSHPEDLENALRFNHVVEMQLKQRLAEVSASFYALVETLIARGQLPLEEYEQRRQLTVQREVERARNEALVFVTDVADKYALQDLPAIDCAARLPLCRARCCTFVFPLSMQDLDERVVRWDYGHPYQIARREDGYCVHNVEGTCSCTVYAQRPAVCRSYDCRDDTRIWIDFEKRIPAP